jgi:hypothetical protein
MPAKRTSQAKTSSSKSRTSVKGKSEKLDLYAKHKNEYVAGRLPVLVRVGPARYLSFPGRSAPGAPEFQNAVGALYTMAFTIKMARKVSGSDYAVTKLEGLWWLDEGAPEPTPTTIWNWQVMLRVPPFITEKERAKAAEDLIEKGKPADVRRVELVELDEGQCVQILHVGPYTEEKESIARMREFAAQAGHRFAGKHHEIYLSDPRRAQPDKLRTILRQPLA